MTQLNSDLLEGLTVIDFSHRLPGPLATYQLQAMGARVIKVEDQTFGDPFEKGLFKEMDPSFGQWYQEFNQNKEVIKKDFKEKETGAELKELCHNSDMIIMGLPLKIQARLGLTFNDLKNRTGSGVFIELVGDPESSKGMHDLNALAQCHLLELYLHQHLKDRKDQVSVLPPPFLPVAGAAFASHIVQVLLGGLLKAQKENKFIYRKAALKEAIELQLVPLFSETLRKGDQRSFLHNGRYPCYNIYPLKDKGALAVASVEEKYWLRLNEILGLNLNPEQRFEDDKDGDVFQTLGKKISSLTYEQASGLFSDQDCCVDLLRAI